MERQISYDVLAAFFSGLNRVMFDPETTDEVKANVLMCATWPIVYYDQVKADPNSSDFIDKIVELLGENIRGKSNYKELTGAVGYIVKTLKSLPQVTITRKSEVVALMNFVRSLRNEAEVIDNLVRNPPDVPKSRFFTIGEARTPDNAEAHIRSVQSVISNIVNNVSVNATLPAGTPGERLRQIINQMVEE